MATRGNKIRGITIELGADTEPFIRSMKSLDNKLKDTGSALKDINKLLKLDPSNTELLALKSENLSKALDACKEKQEQLTEALSKAEKGTDQYSALQRELIETTQKMDGYQKELDETNDALKDTEKSTDKLGDTTKEAAKEAEKGAKGGWSVFKQTLADLSTKAISGAIDGIKKLGGAIINVGKEAINSYADYEQLAGGVEKLFGEAADTVKTNASEAFKTAGMSANEYMQTATQFSAALISELGDVNEAADLVDLAMVSMSDNANTFGTDLDSISNAYKGFAKQTYTMLDNLSLGYGGTKSEMERLIADANEYAATIGEASDLSIENFGDIIKAIDLVQQKQNIAGTTAKEASTTISGSLGMVQNAWQNVLTALADPEADIGAAFDSFIEAAEGLWERLEPVIQTVVDKMAQVFEEKVLPLIDEYMPIIFEKIGTFMDEHLPGFGEILQAFFDSVIMGLTEWLGNLIGQIVLSTADLVKLVTEGLALLFAIIADALVKLLLRFFEFWKDLGADLGKKLREITDTIKEKFQEWKETAGQKVGEIKDGIIEKFQAVKDKVREIWDGIKQTIKDKIEEAKTTVEGIIDKIKGLFKFEWSLPKPKLPKIEWDWHDVGGLLSIPTFHIDWFAKAKNQPYQFNSPSIIGVGDVPEVVVGADLFKQMANGGGNNSTINVSVNATINGDADINALATKIADKIQTRVDTRRVVWR